MNLWTRYQESEVCREESKSVAVFPRKFDENILGKTRKPSQIFKTRIENTRDSKKIEFVQLMAHICGSVCA